MPSPQYLRGIGTIWAVLGIVRWKPVSKHATCGTPGMAPPECFDERDFAGQVFRVEGADSPELIEHLRGHSHRLGEVDSTVDDPVPDGRDRGEP